MQPARTEHRRIELIDIARGMALVAMAVYHFTWDLDFFGYIEPGTSITGGWRIFARSIASSFLFLVGVSLYLAHGGGVRFRSFARRLGLIAAAALAITVVTYFATPNAFIFFGILHHIAVASLLGLLFIRVHVLALVVLAAAAIAAPHFVHAFFLDHPVFWWTGLSRNVPAANDYIPLLPWFGAVLLGIAAAKMAERAGLLARMAGFAPARRVPLLGAAGRHSLAFYLLHQPVLISGLWLFSLAVPPPPPDHAALFMQGCTVQCAEREDEAFCRAFCGCVLDQVVAEERMEDLHVLRRSPETDAWLQDIAFQCAVQNND